MKNIIQRLLLNLTRFILKKVVIRISLKYDAVGQEQNLCVNITVIIPNEAHIMGHCLQLTVEFILVISKINPSN